MTKSEAGKIGYLKSHEIHKKNYDIRVLKYLENPAKCMNCFNVLSYESRTYKYCSRKCSAIVNNKKRTKPNDNCIVCNKQILGKGSKYCSTDCHQKHRWQLKKQEIENGQCNTTTCTSVYKKYLEEKYGHKCSICGISDWNDKPLIMILDHIDGHSENNKIENLRLVCSNCDSQLDTYKAKNKGKGRFSRKQRFLEGKSF